MLVRLRSLASKSLFDLAVALVSLLLIAQTVESSPSPLRWIYFVGRDPELVAALGNRLGAMDVVSPDYFKLDGSGQLLGNDLPELTLMARRAGTKILPRIYNSARYKDFSPVLQDPRIRAKAIGGITQVVVANGYDGINIDFEALEPSDRDGLTSFMAELWGKLKPLGKTVTIAVAAKTSETNTGWAGPYDYQGLAKYADYVIVLAYGFVTSASTRPGSTAPFSWVERSVAFATSQVAPGKLILGIALWGYDWDLTKGPPAVVRTYPETAELARRYSNTGYDETNQSAWLKYEADSHQHEVWYEDKRSVEVKINIAVNRGLAGFAGWRFGHEDPAVWDLFRRYDSPTSPVPPPADPGGRLYFPETGHTVAPPFLAFFLNNGGIDIFGYPRTEQLVENGFTVQYFQRARMEYHPANPTPWQIQLGLLSDERGFSSPPISPFADTDQAAYFPETRHSVAFAFLDYFRRNGGVDIFGYPRTEQTIENGLIVQYFQRARMEWHPSNPAPWRVQLGLLGDELLKARGWLP